MTRTYGAPTNVPDEATIGDAKQILLAESVFSYDDNEGLLAMLDVRIRP